MMPRENEEAQVRFDTVSIRGEWQLTIQREDGRCASAKFIIGKHGGLIVGCPIEGAIPTLDDLQAMAAAVRGKIAADGIPDLADIEVEADPVIH